MATAAPALAQPGEFVRVKVETANLRKGPGTDFGIVRRAYENDPLEVSERKGSWVKVRDFEGFVAWIHGPLTDARPAVIVTTRIANVRAGPGTRHQIVFKAERGVGFRLLKSQARWLNVEHADGDVGWIYQGLVWGAAGG